MSEKLKKCKNCEKMCHESRHVFCSKECYWLWKTIRKKELKPCKKCGKMSFNNTFCSEECRAPRSKILESKCLTCLRSFTYKRSGRYMISDKLYCSNRCGRRKYSLNEYYFKDLTNEKIILLGKLVACGWYSDIRSLHIVSSIDTLESINLELGSNHPIEKSVRGLYQVVIYSEIIISDLIKLGLSNNYFYTELPFYNFDLLLKGIRSTHVYDISKDTYVLNSSRLALELSFRLGKSIRSVTYKDLSIGRMSIEYLVY